MGKTEAKGLAATNIEQQADMLRILSYSHYILHLPMPLYIIIEVDEMVTVKPRQSKIGAQPQITCLILYNGIHNARRQTIPHAVVPGAHKWLTNALSTAQQ